MTALFIVFILFNSGCWFVFGWTMANRRTLRRAVDASLANPILSARSLILLMTETKTSEPR